MEEIKRTEDRAARIRHYEALLNETDQALTAYENALEEYAAAQEKLAALNAYYGSKEWWADFDASEAGELPADLPCGVLSEDGVWELLTRNRELLDETKALLQKLTPEQEA